ncbi:serine/threonine protein kinase [Mariniblastus sp.]|nr:serine/threonine protein kinase [Mariniblastus sp.]
MEVENVPAHCPLLFLMPESKLPTTLKPVDLTGRQLGDYQLLRRLGRGGMADVYLAKQGSLRRNIALKILKPDLAKDVSYVQRFQREAQAAANLVQANIVQIYEVGEVQGFHFIAQEYVQGRNLKQYLNRYGAVEPVMAINVIRQCALALQKAGELHVIHRDIKPENIMLSTKGEVKITDFGLARINNSASKQALTSVGVTMGTPLYMSPEQVEGTAIDQRSDIYSLGVTAYHMLAGHPPFQGDTALVIAVQHVKDTAIPLNELRRDIPLELCQLIEEMMAKIPSDRFDSATQLIKNLRRIKIDLDEDWEMIVEKLATSEQYVMESSIGWSQAKLEATRQLQTVMKGNLRPWWRSSSTFAALLLLCILGMAGGWVLATQTAPSALLNVEQIAQSDVPKMKTAQQQYNEAQMASDRFEKVLQEKYWLAVEENFPIAEAPVNAKNKRILIVRRSKERLAEFYMKDSQWANALAIFNEFVQYDELLGKEFRDIGYSGQAIVFDEMPVEGFEGGEEERTAKIRTAIGNVKTTSSLNSLMKSLFEKVKKKVDRNLDSIEGLDAPSEIQNDSSRYLRFFRVSQVS